MLHLRDIQFFHKLCNKVYCLIFAKILSLLALRNVVKNENFFQMCFIFFQHYLSPPHTLFHLHLPPYPLATTTLLSVFKYLIECHFSQTVLKAKTKKILAKIKRISLHDYRALENIILNSRVDWNVSRCTNSLIYTISNWYLVDITDMKPPCTFHQPSRCNLPACLHWRILLCKGSHRHISRTIWS